MRNTSIILIVILTLIVLPLGVSLINAGEPDQELELKCVRPTVQIMGQRSYGTGVIIRSEKVEDDWVNIVLTCRHVTDDLGKPFIGVVEYKDWSEVDMTKLRRYPAKVIASHPHKDMSLVLFLSKKKMPVAELGMDEKLYIGNEVISLGCGGKEFPRLNYGRVTGSYDDLVRTSLLALPGDSGGPVFHNKKVVAIKQRFPMARVNNSMFPTFHNSKNVSITILRDWAKEESKADIYKEKTTLPQLPVLMLKASEFRPKTSLLDLFLAPDTHP
jgi:hypothetical protein